MKKILIVDGQGGKIGSLVIEQLKKKMAHGQASILAADDYETAQKAYGSFKNKCSQSTCRTKNCCC